MELSDVDKALLCALGDGLPLVPRPYAVIGERLGLSEGEVIERTRALLDVGALKRLGVVVRHRELGYTANAMVVWDVPDDRVQEAGQRLAALPWVTLCYRRPRRLPDWPYNLFCMIHGRDRAVVERQVAEAAEAVNLDDVRRATLFSRRRFKQSGARYTPDAADSREVA